MPFKQLKYILITILWLSLDVINAQADITSPDHTFVANDQYSSDFHTRLNRDIVQLTNGVNNIVDGQVRADTLLERSMADEINPRIRTFEGAACEFVYTGLEPATGASLTTNIAAGTAYPRGFRCNKTSATSKTYTASKWTFVDIDQNCDFQYSEVAIGAATPTVASNSIRLARVSTDATTVGSVVDLRTTTCTDGPFEQIKDVSTESSIEDILKNGSPIKFGGTEGWIQGLHVQWSAHTSFKVTTGSAYINGKFRSVSTDVTVPQTADAPASSTSGIDTGAIAASTAYNVFAVADEDNVKTMSISYSTSSAPTGVTSYRKIGQIITDATSLFTSEDAVTIHAARMVQVVRDQDGAAATTTTVLPIDNTIPQNTEGAEFMSVSITPTRSNNLLRIDVVLFGGETANASTGMAAALFQDSTANALASGTTNDLNSNDTTTGQVVFTHWMNAGTTSRTAFKVRAGMEGAGTFKFNGGNSDLMNGTMASSLTITEYSRSV